MNPEKKIVPDVDPAGLYWESRAAQRLGLPRKVVAELRKAYLAPGTHYVRLANNAVALTEAGLTALTQAAANIGQNGQKPGKPAQTGGKPPPLDVPHGPPPREVMTVQRLSQNGGLLLCVTSRRRAPILVAVRVRSNENFAPNMEIEAMQSGDGVWQFRNRPNGDDSTVGRLPRRKGRW